MVVPDLGRKLSSILLSELPDILELASHITCQVLYLRGDQEPADLYPVEEYQRRAGGPCQIEIVRNCGHFYVDREATVTEVVANWLARTRPFAA